MSTIDELLGRIEQRLDELNDETTRLRMALEALGQVPAGPRAERPTTHRSAGQRQLDRAHGRAAPGSVRPQVLAALADGQPRTPAEIASQTGLRRTTVASTLPRLTRDGAVERAERGYQLPRSSPARRQHAELKAMRAELTAGLRSSASI